MSQNLPIIVDNIEVPVEGERNLLEVIRKAHIELPTFCYHSEISIYGACRMCMVEIEGRGIQPACSTPPEGGMIVRTETAQIRRMRKMIIELMLASHDQDCLTCPKSGDCRLQKIAKQLGVEKVRFRQVNQKQRKDISSDAIIRDPNKCVLCGDCVRVCEEIQSVGVLDFAKRGANVKVAPCFGKGIGEVECVNCGQCVKICPVGALTAKFQINEVWDAIHSPEKTVVVQIAPAVRVALGEQFSFKPGDAATGQIVTALRMMGFDRVYDTSFTADLTVVEEGNEFLKRYTQNERLPQLTSCCPAWVKFAEQYYPDLLPHLSSCKSPQQMFGSVAKKHLSQELEIPREKIVVVSVMPCTAKKFEARRDEFKVDGNLDVDYVLTTNELAVMIKERGIEFNRLDPGSFDLPFGFKTGAGIIFGTTGGVSEAVLRYAADTLGRGMNNEFRQLRYGKGITAAEITVNGITLKLAIVSGLANARKLMDEIRKGDASFDLVEVMACPGGCVNGGGQPAAEQGKQNETVYRRAKGLYDNDTMLQFHNSIENPYLRQISGESTPAHEKHHLLHTEYKNRKRISGESIVLAETGNGGKKLLSLSICFGTSCFLRGSQKLYSQLMTHIRDHGLEESTRFTASFCSEKCKKGPMLHVNGEAIEHCTLDKAVAAIERTLLAQEREGAC
jgi:NADH-quinone oxidoreductase subunit G